MSGRSNFCESCGTSLGNQDRFCQGCGRPLASGPADMSSEMSGEVNAVPVRENTQSNNYKIENTAASIIKLDAGPGASGFITWDTYISLLTNPLILKQLVMVLLLSGLMMSLLLSFLLLVSGDLAGIPSIIMVTAFTVLGVGGLMFLVILIVFRNRFQVRFTVDEKGVLWETMDKRSKTGSRLAVLLGILARSPQTAGAGTLAMAREKEFVGWNEVNNAEYNQNQRMITLRNSWRPVMMMVCTPENYEQVAEFVKQRFESSAEDFAGEKKSPLPKLLLRTVLVVLASTPVFIMPYPFELDYFFPLLMMLFALATVWLVPFMGYVVMGCVLFIMAEIVIISLEVKESIFASIGTYRNYELFDGGDWFFLLMTFAGMAYLVWYSWQSIRGKILPALFEE